MRGTLTLLVSHRQRRERNTDTAGTINTQSEEMVDSVANESHTVPASVAGKSTKNTKGRVVGEERKPTRPVSHSHSLKLNSYTFTLFTQFVFHEASNP